MSPVKTTEQNKSSSVAMRWDVRVAEGARLESVYTLTRIAGSNPAFTAI